MDKATYEIKSQMIDLKAQIGNLTQELKRIQVEHAEDRVFYRAMSGSVNNLSAQVKNLDQQFEATSKKAEHAEEQKTTEAAKKMNITEISELYKKDPVAARKAMEAQGMKIGTETAPNPWLFKDVSEQNRIRSIDPELANRLEAQAAAHYAASNC